MKCKCPKGFPITSWEPYRLYAPERTQWQIDALFRKHTGKCPLHDEFLRVRRMR